MRVLVYLRRQHAIILIQGEIIIILEFAEYTVKGILPGRIFRHFFFNKQTADIYAKVCFVVENWTM